MYEVFMGEAITVDKVVWTRYPQEFRTKEEAEAFAESRRPAWKLLEIRESSPHDTAPVGFDDEDLPNAT